MIKSINDLKNEDYIFNKELDNTDNIYYFIKKQIKEFYNKNGKNIYKVKVLDTNESTFDFIIKLYININDKKEINNFLRMANKRYGDFQFFNYLRDHNWDCLLVADGLDNYICESFKSNEIRHKINELLKELQDNLDWQDYQCLDIVYK